MKDQGSSSQQDAEELEPHYNSYLPRRQHGEPLDDSFAPEGWEDLFDWDAYEKDANSDPNGPNVDYFANYRHPVFSTYIPKSENVPLHSREGTVTQIQDQSPWRNRYNDPEEAARQSMLVLPAMDPEIPDDVINFRLRAQQESQELQDNVSATIMMPRAPTSPIGFGVDNSNDNGLPLCGVMTSPDHPYKQFPTAGAESSPDASVDTPSKAGRKQKSVEQAKSPSKQSTLKKAPTKIVSRKRKATSSPPNDAKDLVLLSDNNGDKTDNGSATAVPSINPPPTLPDLLSDLAEDSLPSSVNNSLVPTPAPSASERRERLKNTLAEYQVDRMTAWKALPPDTRSRFLRELLRAYRRQALEPWELELINSSTQMDWIHGCMDIALEADLRVQTLEQRHNRLRQKFEASKQSELQLRQWLSALNNTVQKNEAEKKELEKRIADLERSHLVLNQILDERIHLVHKKVNVKVKELEDAIAKLKASKEGLSEEEDDESGL